MTTRKKYAAMLVCLLGMNAAAMADESSEQGTEGSNSDNGGATVGNIIDRISDHVTLYGVLDYGVSYVSYVSDEGGESNTRVRDGVNWGNRLGLKGEQDLNYGLKAIFTLEHGFNLSDGTTSQYGTTWGRQAFAGLEHDDYGTLTFGRQYDFIFDYLNQLNIGGYASVYAGHHGDFDRISGWRVDKSVKYQSPSFGGLKFGAMYGTDGSTYAFQDSGSNETFSLGATYFGGNWGLSAVYLNIKDNAIYPDLQIGVTEFLGQTLNFDGSAVVVDQETIGVGGFYQVGDMTLVANSTQTKFENDNGEEKQNVYEAGGYYPVFDKTLAIVGYQHSKLEDDKWDQVTFGLKHDLSEKTWVYASYSWMRASEGIKANQGAGWYLENSSDNRQDTARVGIIYTF
ncbi:porin [Marinobacter sp. JSM 1782161]|uniref:porin n=1 Tax=Marinobacter sp. JSM 1782161 TaxID=2685906 RepID=UPI001403BEA2|nr:porin [Marinobacter sp. JSM 1782161]